MNCRTVDHCMAAYLDDALPDRRARAVATHLETCSRCRREQKLLEDALRALDRVGNRTPAIDLWASFSERLAAETTRAPSLPRVPFLWRSFSCAAAVAVAAGACVLSLAITPSPSPSSLAARLGSENLSRTLVERRTPSAPRSPLAALPPVTSPEFRLPAEWSAPSGSAQETVPPRDEAIEPPALLLPPRPPLRDEQTDRIAVLPAGDLASVAEFLIDAQQDAARTQVASELFALAEEMVRINQVAVDGKEERL
jgi:hypothetical protein